ncbi:MAG: HEAT repeat domain-containing protein [Deltaproteobacteria bacterium]|nr:HEAT repeat domain-containing protein [Deltaproteobacteria bacterium]
MTMPRLNGHRLATIVGTIIVTVSPATARQPHPLTKDASLIRVLRHHRDALKRESAALLLGLAGNRASVPALIAALEKDPVRWVRGRAAEALGHLGDRHAIDTLKKALGRAKNQDVRRDIARALMRLGDRAGLLELMWQLRSGHHHDKAEAMRAIVAATGQALGQDVKAWWRYLAAHGYAQIASRRGTWHELTRAPNLTKDTPLGHRGWRPICVTVLDVGPTREPLTARRLRRAVARRGGIGNGCLLLLRTAWRDAKLLPRRHPPRLKKKPLSPLATTAPANATPSGLTLEGLRYLQTAAPKLAGIAIDTPHLDLPGPGQPVRDALNAAHGLALINVNIPPWLTARQRSALAIQISPSETGRQPRVLLLIHLP